MADVIDGKNCCYIATKIDTESYKRWKKVLEDGGFKSDYEAMQYLVTVFLRYADPDGSVEAENTMDANLAELFTEWQNEASRIIAVNPKSSVRLKLTDSVNIYTMVGKRGYVCRKVTFRSEGRAMLNNNVDDAINVVIRKLRPQMAEQLTEIARGCGTLNMVSAIKAMLEETHLPRLKAGESEAEAEVAQNEYGITPVRHNNWHRDENV